MSQPPESPYDPNREPVPHEPSAPPPPERADQPPPGWTNQPPGPAGQPPPGWTNQPPPGSTSPAPPPAGWTGLPPEQWPQQPPPPGGRVDPVPPAWPQQQTPWPQQQAGWPQQQPGPWEHLGPPAPPQRRRGRRAPLIAAVAAVAVIGGGTATYLAVSDSHSGFQGAATPEKAVTSLVADLNKSDLIGILDHLAPSERAALLDPLEESISQAKRLHILDGSANASSVSAVDITAKNITFDTSKDVVNDHVTVVKLVGGTITVNADLSKVPFTRQYLELAFPNGMPSNTKASGTVDIGQAVRERGEPVRIATQKVNGKWFPSIMYTIADQAAHNSGAGNPGPSDVVAAKGASSAEDAVRQAIDAIQHGDYRRLIELTSPDELRVLHDYGGLILENATPGSAAPWTVKDLRLNTKKVSGATRVTLKSITVDADGHETTVAVDGDCLGITADGDFRKLCADDLIKRINTDTPLSADESAALGRLASGIPNLGVDVTESDGQWYVNPVRSYLDLTNEFLEPLHDNDLIVLLNLISR